MNASGGSGCLPGTLSDFLAECTPALLFARYCLLYISSSLANMASVVVERISSVGFIGFLSFNERRGTSAGFCFPRLEIVD